MTVYTNRAARAAQYTDAAMRAWLRGGTTRQDGRLALFDQLADPIDKSLIKTAVVSGYAEPWFASPMRPQWTVYRLTPKGRAFLERPAKTR
jgi:hypothetical protein